MARRVAIGIQNFNEIIEGDFFYIDKTSFIKDWWESGDSVTLITRLRHFGKTLNMRMLEQFFSVDYAGRGELFEGLSVWEEESIKQWYDGFTFGNHADIYNPWSILNFLDTGKYGTYWANSSSNSLVGKLIREGSKRMKTTFEVLLKDGTIRCPIDEQIVYEQLDKRENAIWSLLLASGYLKVISKEQEEMLTGNYPMYELTLTNYEVKRMFLVMINNWFEEAGESYSEFVSAMLTGDKKAMNVYMNRVALNIFSYFDTGNRPSGTEPERFYHGFVLGLIAELYGRYTVTSNRESGFGRYDVMIESNERGKDAFILEFKVYDPEKEETLKDTVSAALQQIEEKQYAASLVAKGVPEEKIYKYGFAFEGKKVLIG